MTTHTTTASGRLAPSGYLIPWEFDDGGLKAEGWILPKTRRDCVCRSIAIATGLGYTRTRDLILEYAKRERPNSKRRRGRRSHPSDGVWPATYKQILADLGWVWTPTMKVGSGCTHNLRVGCVPMEGPVVVRLSVHLTAMVDGVIRDTHDPSRDGTRCVYGYWTPGGAA